MSPYCNFCRKMTKTIDGDCEVCKLSKVPSNIEEKPYDWVKQGRPATRAEKKRIAIQMGFDLYYFIEHEDEWKKAEAEILERRKRRLVADAIVNKATQAQTVEEAEKEFRCYTCEHKNTCAYAWDAYNVGDDWCLAEK